MPSVECPVCKKKGWGFYGEPDSCLTCFGTRQVWVEPAAPTREDFFGAMAKELDYAYAKHGKELWGRHEFASILREEFDELWDDIKADAPTEQLLMEVVQVAAMCLRYAETGDKRRGAHPPLVTR